MEILTNMNAPNQPLLFWTRAITTLLLPARLCVKIFFGKLIQLLVSSCKIMHDVAMMWSFESIFHRTKTIKIETDIMNKDNGIMWSSMCSLIEILCVLKEKISLIPHDMNATEFFKLNLLVNICNILSNWVNFLGIFTCWEKLTDIERNTSFWNSCLMPWRPIFNRNCCVENFCFTFSIANMVENERQRELQTMI